MFQREPHVKSVAFQTGAVSETAADIDSGLHGASLLCEASVHGFKVECLILFIERIVDPESDFTIAFMQGDASVQGAVQCLAGIVLLCPVNASCRLVVYVYSQVVQQFAVVERLCISSAYGEGMLRYERHVVAVVADFHDLSLCVLTVGHIVGKGGIRITVVTVQADTVGKLCTYAGFGSYAPALSSVDRNTSQTALCKA